MDYFNSTEFDNALNHREKLVVEILQKNVPKKGVATNNPKNLEELLHFYKEHYEEITLMCMNELSENAEKILEKFTGKANERVCEKMLRDPLFERIIGDLLKEGIPADSFIELVTKIDLQVKINVIKSSKRVTEAICQTAEIDNFE